MIMIITIYIYNIYKEQYYFNLSILKNSTQAIAITMASAQSDTNLDDGTSSTDSA